MASNMLFTVTVLSCVWLGWYVRYHPCDMLDIPQQNPLKYGFSGLEAFILQMRCIIIKVYFAKII